jgi:hypothetical protein
LRPRTRPSRTLQMRVFATLKLPRNKQQTDTERLTASNRKRTCVLSRSTNGVGRAPSRSDTLNTAGCGDSNAVSICGGSEISGDSDATNGNHRIAAVDIAPGGGMYSGEWTRTLEHAGWRHPLPSRSPTRGISGCLRERVPPARASSERASPVLSLPYGCSCQSTPARAGDARSFPAR